MRKKRHFAEEIVNKLREADVELSRGQTGPAGLPEDRGHGADLLPVAA